MDRKTRRGSLDQEMIERRRLSLEEHVVALPPLIPQRLFDDSPSPEE
jgi:hypothetical protein